MFGSFERFLGILVEHLGGAFPTWLSPIQAVVLPIADRHDEYGGEVVAALRKAGVRAELRGGERVNARIRDAEKEKIPWMLVVGDREAEEGTVSVRSYHEGRLGSSSVTDLVAKVKERIESRAFDVVLKETARLPSIMDAPTSEDEAY
jgi:threonyl-tRNA synthetase